jgi:type II secretory pathway component PulM
MPTSFSRNVTLFWRQRSRRERVLLALMTLLLAAVAAMQLVWQPLLATERRLEQSVQVRQAQLLWLQSLAREASGLRERSPQPVLAAAELLPLLRQGAADAGLALDQATLVAEGEHGVALQGKVAFDDWLRCAAILSERYHLRLTTFHVEADAVPGRVTLRAVFVHGGAAA